MCIIYFYVIIHLNPVKQEKKLYKYYEIKIERGR